LRPHQVEDPRGVVGIREGRDPRALENLSALHRFGAAHPARQKRLTHGTVLVIRPGRPEDEPLMRPFHLHLSDESVYRPYAHVLRLADRISHERLARLCFIDYAHEMALVALRTNASSEQELVAIGRLIMEHERNEAELALLVLDTFQGKGLGTELLRRLVEIARKEQVGRLVGYILADNQPMLQVCRRLGFHQAHEPDNPIVESIIDLS